jgi:hypothetical protein
MHTTKVVDVPSNPSFLDSIRRDIRLDFFAHDVLNHIDPNRDSFSTSKSSHKDSRQFSWRVGLLFRKKHLYVRHSQTQRQVLQYCHDMPMARHFDVHMTLVRACHSKLLVASAL